MPEQVLAPDGRTWEVRRLWLSRPVRWPGRRWPFLPRRDSGVEDTAEAAADAVDGLGCLAELSPTLAIGLAVVLVVLFVLPSLLSLVELLLLVLLGLLGVTARLLRLRPWLIEARVVAGPTEERRWRVLGWRAANEKAAAVADDLRAGLRPQDEV